MPTQYRPLASPGKPAGKPPGIISKRKSLKSNKFGINPPKSPSRKVPIRKAPTKPGINLPKSPPRKAPTRPGINPPKSPPRKAPTRKTSIKNKKFSSGLIGKSKSFSGLIGKRKSFISGIKSKGRR